MDRRHLLALAGGASAVALSGCSTVASVVTAIPTFVTAIRDIGAEIQPLISLVGGSVPSSIGVYLSNIVNLANTITDAATAAQGQSVLGQIEAYINALAPVVLPVVTAINPAIGAGLGLVVAALPAIEALVSMASLLIPSAAQLATLAPAPATALFGAAAPARMTPNDYLNELIRRHS